MACFLLNYIGFFKKWIIYIYNSHHDKLFSHSVLKTFINMYEECNLEYCFRINKYFCSFYTEPNSKRRSSKTSFLLYSLTAIFWRIFIAYQILVPVCHICKKAEADKSCKTKNCIQGKIFAEFDFLYNMQILML